MIAPLPFSSRSATRLLDEFLATLEGGQGMAHGTAPLWRQLEPRVAELRYDDEQRLVAAVLKARADRAAAAISTSAA